MLREELFVCITRKTYPVVLYEVTCQNQKGYIAVIYSSPSQSCNEFEDFLFNLEKIVSQITKNSSHHLQ